MSDRTVHASCAEMEVVRYGRAGKWYLEPVDPGTPRQRVTFLEAVTYAVSEWSWSRGVLHFGRPGGNAFDREARDRCAGLGRHDHGTLDLDANQQRLIVSALVGVIEACGVPVPSLTGPQLLDLADQTTAEVGALRARVADLEAQLAFEKSRYANLGVAYSVRGVHAENERLRAQVEAARAALTLSESNRGRNYEIAKERADAAEARIADALAIASGQKDTPLGNGMYAIRAALTGRGPTDGNG